jgi:uncharacterized protein (TIGR04255 family)
VTRKYNKPPVIESVCEFRFEAGQPLDLTLPGLLYGELKEYFPISEQANITMVTLDVGGNQIAQQMQNAARFLTEDRSEFVQIALSPQALSITQLVGYRGWVHFKARISLALTAYQKLLEGAKFARIGLRYINRIELPPGRHELDDYFRFMPKAPEPIPQIFQSFLAQVQIPYGGTPETPESILRLSISNTQSEVPENYAVLFDLDMFTLPGNIPEPNEVFKWLDTAHQRLEDAFDVALTEKTHTEIFEEVSS